MPLVRISECHTSLPAGTVQPLNYAGVVLPGSQDCGGMTEAHRLNAGQADLTFDPGEAIMTPLGQRRWQDNGHAKGHSMTTRVDIHLSKEEEAEVEALVHRIRDWLNSDDGEKAVQEASKRSALAAEKRASEQELDVREFDRPITC